MVIRAFYCKINLLIHTKQKINHLSVYYLNTIYYLCYYPQKNTFLFFDEQRVGTSYTYL